MYFLWISTWSEMSPAGVFTKDLDLYSSSDGEEVDLFQYGIDCDSEYEHMPRVLNRKENSYEPELFSPKTPVSSSDGRRSSPKRRSPASRASRACRLLAYQERLVKERGFPKSRLQLELESEMSPSSPTPPIQHSPKPVRCRKNLSGEFQRLGTEARHQNLTDPSTGSQLEGETCGKEGNFRDTNVYVSSSGRQEEEKGRSSWDTQEKRTVVEGGGVSPCESQDLETVTSNTKNYSMLCSQRFGQELGEQFPLQAWYVPIISPSRPSDAWWMNWGTVQCSACNNWGYIHPPPTVFAY